MTDTTSTAMPENVGDWLAVHRQMYLGSGGAKGHIMDLSLMGGHPFTTHCMIKYTGRKSGKVFITPLIYADIGGEVVICASKGGADDSPQWYQNILASETVDLQIATQAYRASWREPQGDERERVWTFMVDCFPFYATYQTRTTRLIPLVMLKTIASLPVFSEADLPPSEHA